MAKFLRIAQWNANGLAQHKGEVPLPTTKQDRHIIYKRNPLHHEDSLSNTTVQYLLHQSSRRHCARGHSHTSETDNSALRIIAIST